MAHFHPVLQTPPTIQIPYKVQQIPFLVTNRHGAFMHLFNLYEAEEHVGANIQTYSSLSSPIFQ